MKESAGEGGDEEEEEGGVLVPSPQTASVPQLILARVWESLCCGLAGGASALSSLSSCAGNLGLFFFFLTLSPLLGFLWLKMPM